MLPSERGSICVKLYRELCLFCQKLAMLSGTDWQDIVHYFGIECLAAVKSLTQQTLAV
ncbi:hypothetical protein BN439_1355 [Erwinia amylovora Ea644]|uniref:Uncharacterized protein n=2 Tax=Erwinia amylovora TaxID=552 RepID=D4HYN2_ERWAC|nr:hypothetical protein predicted by Glimmer/Critica [Erwinia amylovora CFBP1430]CBX79907.1 hypothetical protein predicted by Glimmer/Critica [Erwinia amylovora ATCC BAA-2158]CCO77908.1 hypothetical protein BN432_1086 [Erwinia amylovora Ea356]CCO85499.1 hypothetical protein BN434_1087 [Erwinia amylovora CFBP 2585]CCO89284.1 hypothetical protein BN435_1088 [Erwinia amylovora 01SFR-BO]CCO98392.1 hypothetical protein BN438_1086 [Erwinia amylovora UPN527]CCP02435.1 hypothetical protein BN439_1355